MIHPDVDRNKLNSKNFDYQNILTQKHVDPKSVNYTDLETTINLAKQMLTTQQLRNNYETAKIQSKSAVTWLIYYYVTAMSP